MTKSLNLILFFAITSIFAIGFIISRDSHSILYWVPFIWAALLAYFNWKVLTQLFNEKTRIGLFGVLPAMLLVLVAASAASVILVFYSVFANMVFSKVHLISQIILILVAVVIFLFLNAASHVSEKKYKSTIMSKNDLIIALNKASRTLSDEQSFRLKSIIEKIEFDLPHDTKLLENSAWKEISKEIKDIRLFSNENITYIETRLNEI